MERSWSSSRLWSGMDAMPWVRIGSVEGHWDLEMKSGSVGSHSSGMRQLCSHSLLPPPPSPLPLAVFKDNNYDSWHLYT